VVSLQASPSATTRQVAQSFLYKIDRIHYFDIRHLLFDIRFFTVSTSFDWLFFKPAAALNPEP
jgi:hypothetical protein